MRILHVEDDPSDADLVARALTRKLADIALDTVGTLAEAREYLQGPRQFDVALIDLKLPDGSGLDLLAEIREQDLPMAIVMLTGSGDQNAAITALQFGADDYVPKNIDAFGRLLATLKGACQRFTERTTRRSRLLRVLYAEHNRADADLSQRHVDRHAPYIRLTVVPDALLVLSHLPPDNRHPCDFDVLLLDYRLPGLDALDTIKLIRDERGLDIPIVIVSGQGSEEVAAKAIRLGVDDYISKHPGYLYELPPTLEMVHRQHELLREQHRLRETSKHLNYLMEASPVILYTLHLDAAGAHANWVSSNVYRLLGFTPQETLEPGWWQRQLHPDDKAATLTNVAVLREQGHVVQDYRCLDKHGNLHWIRDELRVVSGAGDASDEVVGAWHDITVQKQSEQIQQIRLATLDGLVDGLALEEVLDRIVRQLETIRPDMRVSVLLHDARRQALFTAAAPSLPAFFNAAVDGLRPQHGNGSCGTAAALGETVIVSDVMNHPYWAPYTELAGRAGIRACWSVPFKDDAERVIGTFGIYHDEIRTPGPQDLHLVGEFARIAALAVQRANADAKLRQAATVFDSTEEGVLITDLMPRIIAVNRAFSEITGYPEAEVIGCNPGILNSGRQDEAFFQGMWASLRQAGHWQGEIWNRRKNGEIFPQLLTISTVRDPQGAAKSYVGVMTDMSRLKQSEADVERLAHFDPLTGLPNRLLIQSRLQHTLSRAKREGCGVAVLFIDLDRFKNINESLGHPAGDELLTALARRFRQRLRAEDTLGRLGGDEFLVVLDHSHSPDDAATIARELISLLEEPFELPELAQIYIGASIGISLFPQDGAVASELIQHADAAMYEAKEQGRNTFRFYTPSLTNAVNQRLALESRMRRALVSDEFVVFYQPQIDIASGRVTGCEALVRWQDPDKGLVPPAEFIPLAEETGLIMLLGEWVLRTACAQCREWIDRGLPPLTMAINLSARQLQQSDIVERIAQIIDNQHIPPHTVKLELTESSIMGRGEQAIGLLNAIKALGVGLSIDDFGTGYSSLAALKRFPIDELKIDRSFVRDIPDDHDDVEIATTIIAMARNLRLKVIAEGVETRQQVQFLIDNGCPTYQGYLFSPPLPASEVETLIRSMMD